MNQHLPDREPMPGPGPEIDRLQASADLWKPGGGYYLETASQLKAKPVLPDLTRLTDRRLRALFEGHARSGSRVLEIGCGGSAWLPYLGLLMGCTVVGIDIEPFAAELARANLAGAGVQGEILCRDGFDLEANADLARSFDLVYSRGVMEHFADPVRRLRILASYLKSHGRILTTVPNLQGVNWWFQRIADLERLDMHVVYDAGALTRVHEDAGFRTIAAGYVGFYDGWMTASGPGAGRLRQRIHHWLCRVSSLGGAAFERVCPSVLIPELRWMAPHVFYVGRPS